MRKRHFLFGVIMMALAGCGNEAGTGTAVPDLPIVNGLEAGMARSAVTTLLPSSTDDGLGGLAYDTTLADGTRIEAALQFENGGLSNAQINLIPADAVATDSLLAQFNRHFDRSHGAAVRDGDYLTWTHGNTAIELADESATYGSPHVSLTLYPTFSR